MSRRLLSLALTILWSAPATAQTAAPPVDPDVEAGIALVETGDFERGIVVLDGAVRRLNGSGHSGQRARAYLHLGIAYLGLAQVEAARDRFRAALAEAGDLTLSTDEFPPKVVELFEQTRHEWASRRAAAPGTGAALAVGNRVRLLSADTGPIKGTLLALDDASLVLASEDGARLTVGRDSITQLELGVGSHRHTLRGLLTGAAVGVAVAISPIDADDCGMTSVNYCSRGDAIGSGIVAAALGALVGWAIKSDRWAPVTLDVSGIDPASGRSAQVRLGVRLAF
jgi:hypothetical protein